MWHDDKMNSKFSDFFLDIFGSILTSSVVLAHLRQSSVVFGNIEIIGNCWKMAKKYIGLFGALLFCFWKIIYCYSAKKMLSNYPNSDPPLTYWVWWQNCIKTLSSVVDPPAQWAQAGQNSQVSFQMSDQYRLCIFSSTTNRLPKLILASSSIFYDLTN